MKTLPNKSVDLFLCDLPYGCLNNNRVAKRVGKLKDKADPNSNIIVENRPCKWDIKINLEEFWAQVERLAKTDNTPIIHFCNAKFGYELIKSKESWFRYDLIWEKTNGVGFLSSNKQPMRSHELIYVFSKKGANYYRKDIQGDFPRIIGGSTHSSTYNASLPNTTRDNKGIRCVKSVITVANKKGKGKHPTQKPAELYKFLIERYSKEGDTILDPTAGSFTSVLTAHEMNRTAIGIELDQEFYLKAKAIAETLNVSA